MNSRSIRSGCLAVATIVLGVLSLVSEFAQAWTSPLELSAPSSHERSTPRIACGASGRLYVVYVNKSSPWQVLFRERSAAGHWGDVEPISSVFATRPDVVEDGQGRPHVVYAGTGTAGSLDLVHAYRNAGVWSGGFITATSDSEDQPHLVSDSLGRIHMICTKGPVESSSATVMHRVWDGTGWSDETPLGSVVQSYYHRPHVAIGPDDRLHVAWIDRIGGVYRIRYRHRDGSVWSPTTDVGSGDQAAHFFSYVRIAALSAEGLLTVWHDDAAGGGSRILYNHSGDGGTSWAFGLSGSDQGQILYSGHYPSLDAADGLAHLVSNLEPSEKTLLYSRWNGSAWTVNQQPIFTNDSWTGWSDVAADAAGTIHVVWDDVHEEQHRIAYSASAPDSIPPAPLTDFAAVAGHGRVMLSWTNPADPDFTRSVVRVDTAGYPLDPADGTLVADRSAAPGSSDEFVHTGLVNATTYYYSAFTRDVTGNWSERASAAATPFVPPDLDRDGDVDLDDFGLLQACFSGEFVPQEEPACRLARMDRDEDVDQQDAAIFLGCLSGPNVPYDPLCAG